MSDSAATAQVRLSLLGGFQARLTSGEEISLPTAKARALLARLALPAGETHGRDRLAGLLWSDSADAQARASLRQALTAVRQALKSVKPCPLVADSRAIRLIPEAVHVDVAEFESLTRSALPKDLRGATELYRGPLLDGFTLRNNAFETWLAVERERLHERQALALAKLLDHEMAAETHEWAIETAQRLLDHDPLREDSHRMLMRLYAEQGQRARALRQYQQCLDLLARELNVEPEAETQRLCNDIREQRLMPRPNPIAVVQPGTDTAPAKRARPSIAVLAFLNLSGDPEQDHLADGMAEDLITELSHFRSLSVVARSSSFAYKNQSLNAWGAGRKLGVDYLLEGSVRTGEGRVRVNAQLIDTASGNHLWAHRFDRNLEGIFSVQDELIETIVAAIEPEIGKAERQRAQTRKPDNMNAWNVFHRANARMYRRTREDLEEAKTLFHRAIELDPSFSPAYAHLADAYFYEVLLGFADSPATHIGEAESAARTAIELDDEDAAAHCAMGKVYIHRKMPDAAIWELKTAIALNPNFAQAHHDLGMAMLLAGRAGEGIPHLDEAIRLSPQDPWIAPFYSCKAMAHMLVRQHDEAVEWARKALGQPHVQWPMFASLAAALGHLGRREEAAHVLLEMNQSMPDLSPDTIRDTLPLMDAKDRAHLLDGLRKAGLPLPDDDPREVSEAPALRAPEREGGSESPPRPVGPPRTHVPPAPVKPSIAVLPFINLGGDPEQAYFSNGITEDIITQISRFPTLFVIARNSSFAQRDKAEDVTAVARALGVHFVVEGSVRRSGNQIRINIQLVDGVTGHHIWAERYDRDLADLFAVQDEVTQTIVATLAGRLEVAGRRQAKRKGAEYLEAYDYVLRGNEHFYVFTKADNATARKLYQQAIELDADCARGHLGLARAELMGWMCHWAERPDKSFERAFTSAESALRSDDSDSLTHAILGEIFLFRREYQQSVIHLDRALALNRNDADAIGIMGFLLTCLGRPQEGIEHFRTAKRLNPYQPDWCMFCWRFGIAQYTAGSYETAISCMKEIVSPINDVRGWLAACYAQAGKLDEARRALAEFLRIAEAQGEEFPGRTLAAWRPHWAKFYPYRDGKDLEHALEGLRKAGLE